MKNPINIIFDGPPDHDSGRFVEVETDDGKSIKSGELIERPDGLWALRITALPEKDIKMPLDRLQDEIKRVWEEYDRLQAEHKRQTGNIHKWFK